VAKKVILLGESLSRRRNIFPSEKNLLISRFAAASADADHASEPPRCSIEKLSPRFKAAPAKFTVKTLLLRSKRMKIILYMATTINGFVAKENDDTSWVTETEWASFRSVIKRVGNLIIGSRTYEIMQKGGEFKDLEKIKVVAVASGKNFEADNPSHSVVHSPNEAIEFLEQEGFNEALVAGGGMLNGSFMTENLIDEIYIDVEPMVLGKGIKLFDEKDFERRLELIETKKLSENEIQLHYRVLK
jgi:dihydrofolate reductase